MTTLQETSINFKKTAELLPSLVKRFGKPVSTLLLNTPCQTFGISAIEGLIGYQLVNSCAVVIGDPLCLPESLSALTKAFQDYCLKQGWRIIYFFASEFFAHWAIDNGFQISIEVGEEMILNPMRFKVKQKIRWKVSQSIRQGVVFKEYQNEDAALEMQMKESIDTWVKARAGPQIYLGTLNLFPKDKDTRIFYAVQGQKIVGLLSISCVDLYQGWVVTSYFATPTAPVGVTEYLMISVFEILARENCSFICLGAVSRSKVGGIVGLNPFKKILARFIFEMSNWIFHLDRRKRYFNKYHPTFRPAYLVFNEKLSFKELFALKKIIMH